MFVIIATVGMLTTTLNTYGALSTAASILIGQVVVSSGMFLYSASSCKAAVILAEPSVWPITSWDERRENLAPILKLCGDAETLAESLVCTCENNSVTPFLALLQK